MSNLYKKTFGGRFGFSLIELLVVMTIIAILIGAGTVSYTKAQQRGRDGQRKSDLKRVQAVLEVYIQQNGKYPSSSSGSIQCNVGLPDPLTWGTSNFTCNSITYLKNLPKDPKYQSTTGYYYRSYGSPNPTSYDISAELENDNDPDRITGPTPCTPYGGRDYCVKNP